MKSFFQRFHDSQLGTSKSRTKDAAYKQWIPSSKADKDRSQPPNGADTDTNISSKRYAPKTAGLRSVDVPNPEALGRVTTDYSTRFSTFPGSSVSRNLPPPLPLPQSRTPEPSSSKAPNLKPLDDTKEKGKLPPRHNETTDLSSNEKDVVPRIKPERPSRSRQTSVPPVSRQHQMRHPAEMEMGPTEKGKRKERPKQVDESDVGVARAPQGNGYPDRRDGKPHESGISQEPGGDHRRRMETKGRERRERRREQPPGRAAKDEQWNQQEKDMYQLREALERERGKPNDRMREKERGKDEDRSEQKERENEREKERERNRERERRDKEKAQREEEAVKLQLLREHVQREAKEQQEREQQEKEQQEKERKERRERKERKAREAREQQAERDRREQIEMQRKERERQAAEQRERERQQQDRWELEQDERERKALERLERDRRREERRRKEQVLRQRESDNKEMDLLKLERERQEQRKREREQWEQQREREREERERRWRGGGARETPEAVLTDTGTNDKSSIRSRHKNRRDGVSDSERETTKAQGPDKRRLSRPVAQTNTPPKPEDRMVPIVEPAYTAVELAQSRSSKQHILNGATDVAARIADSRQVLREDGYVSEQSATGQVVKDTFGRGIDSSRPRLPSIQEIRSPPPVQKQLPLNPPISAQPAERFASTAPRLISNDSHITAPESSGQVYQLTEEAPQKSQSSPTPDAQLAAHQSRTAAMNISEAGHPSSRPGLVFTEPRSRDVRPMALTEVKPSELPQEIRILSPPPTIQVSQSNGTSASRILLNFPQDTISSKDTRPPGQNGALASFQPTVPNIMAQRSSSTRGPFEHSPPALPSFPSNISTEKNPLSKQAQSREPQVPIPVTSTQNPSLSRPSQHGHSTSQNLAPSDLMSLREPQAKEQVTVPRHIMKESPPQVNSRKDEHVAHSSRTHPSDILGSTVVDSRSVMESRPDTTPGRDETRQDLLLPSNSSKPIQTPRASPRHISGKVQDDTPPQNHAILAHPGKQDLKSRTPPFISNTPLQEFTPPAPRQHLSDRSSHQENRIHPPVPPVQPQPETNLLSEYYNASRNHKHRDLDPTRVVLPASTDNHGFPLPRHQRHHSETETGHRELNPSPRSQPVESPHIMDPQLTESSGLKSKSDQKNTKVEDPSIDARAVNIAFRTPVVEVASTVDKNQPAEDPHSDKTFAAQESADHRVQQRRKQSAQGVSTLVSHYEQLEATAHLGGTIVRPGTTVPRASTTRSVIPEALSSQTRTGVHPVVYSQSSSAPQIDRPNTAIGIRPSVSSTSQSQSRNTHVTSIKQERARFEPVPFPDKMAQNANMTVPTTTTGLREDHGFSQTSHPSDQRFLHPIPEVRPVLVSSVAPDRPGTNHRLPLDAPVLSRKISYSDGAIATDIPSRSAFKSTTTENYRVPRTGLPPDASVVDRSLQQSTENKDEQIPARQHTGGQGESITTQSQSIYPISTLVHGDAVIRKGNMGNFTRESDAIHPSQPRSRKESSPRVRPRDDQPKLSASRAGDAEDYRAQPARSGQAYGDSRGSAPALDTRYVSQRTEPTRVDPVYTAGPQALRYTPEPSQQYSQPSAYPQSSSVDDKNRNRHNSSNYPPQASQRTPPINPASVSPQRTGNSAHSNLDEETTASQNQKNSMQVKDARLAELLSPPKPNDVSHHSYLHGARKNLASKLDQQLSSSPNHSHGQLNSEGGSRPRGSSNRGEHSPRYGPGGDSSPSGAAHSPPHNQQPDITSRDYSHVRSSPNASHHTPSPRTKTITPENPGPQPRDEGSRPVSAQSSRQPPARERRQDGISDAESTLPHRHHPPSYTTYDTDTRTDEMNRPSHIPSTSGSNQIWDPQSGRTSSQKDNARKRGYDTPQSITLTHSRTRSDPQNRQEISSSRHAYNVSYNTTSIQTQASPHAPASIHATSSSAPSIPSLGQLSDQMLHTRSYSSNQQPPTREEASIAQAPPTKSTPSKRNFIAPLPPDIRSNSSSSNPQPPTPKSYEIWLPPSAQSDQIPSRSTPAPAYRRDAEREPDRTRRTSAIPRARSPSPPRRSQYLPYQPSVSDPRLANPYHYIKTRKMRTMSTVSLEAQDGAASTVIGSPTASILSQIPINVPPEQDPILAAREWTEAAPITPGQRIRRPGLVWELPEDPPPIHHQQDHRRPESRSSRSRRPRSSNSRSRETSDAD